LILPGPFDLAHRCCHRHGWHVGTPHSIWRDDFEAFGPDRWTEIDPAWAAPELDLGDGRRLVLDAPDPFPEEEWAVAGVN